MSGIQSPSGIVISVDRQRVDPRAVVEVDARQICPRCREGKGCGAGIFGASGVERRVDALLAPGSSVKQGDIVNLELGSRNLLQAATIVYGWPLAGAAVGALLAWSAGLGDAGAAIAALAGLLAGGLAVRRRLGQADCLARFVPTVVDGPARR